MTSETLFEAFGNIDESYIISAKETGNRPAWGGWRVAGTIAACVCLMAAALFAVAQWRTSAPPDNPVIGADTADPSESGDMDSESINQPVPPEETDDNTTPPIERVEIIYNIPESVAYGEASLELLGYWAIFGETLTSGEFDMVMPDYAPEWCRADGSAQYYGWGELERVSLTFANPSWNGSIGVSIYPADKGLRSDVAFTLQTTEKSVINGINVTAYEYDGGSRVELWVMFERDGVGYMIHDSVAPDDVRNAKSDISDIVHSYAYSEGVPDLDVFVPRERPVPETEDTDNCDAGEPVYED